MARARRHTPEQTAATLKPHEAGLKTGEVCRQHGIREQTPYRWISRYEDLSGSWPRRSLHQVRWQSVAEAVRRCLNSVVWVKP